MMSARRISHLYNKCDGNCERINNLASKISDDNIKYSQKEIRDAYILMLYGRESDVYRNQYQGSFVSISDIPLDLRYACMTTIDEEISYLNHNYVKISTALSNTSSMGNL